MSFFRRTQKPIYLDYAAATPFDSVAWGEMECYSNSDFGNPLSKHDLGKRAARGVSEARVSVAKTLNVRSAEIIFTSGATESNALALEGCIRGLKKSGIEVAGKNIVISNLEHPSVRGVHALAELYGVEIREALSDEEGIVKPDEVFRNVDEDTLIVSVVYVNSEIGTIQPISRIAKDLKKKWPHIFFHTDASQSPLWIRLDIQKLGVDIATFDASKFHGPKGCGILFVKRGTPLAPLFFTMDPTVIRPGTPATPLIVACARALEESQSKWLEETIENVSKLRDMFIRELELLPRARINGSHTERIANNVSVSFESANHEYLRVLLNERGIYTSTGSACASGEEGVRSIEALGGDMRSAIRFTLPPGIEKEEVLRVVEVLREILKKGLV